ncbi:DUF4916 domain-containing protein [Microbacterium aurantiacum]|uniref:DUF4916 domain-containing protein n=1 Tax=Microbacterium aurantiacum TaxID=162393 RepID=UPI003F493A48
MTFLPADLYARIEESMPIACVDFVPVREVDGRREIGLILRDSPHGRVWCHLGGRIQRGETIAVAIRRHCVDTLGLEPVLPLNPQPAYVYEWFPHSFAPTDGTVFGDDPRKHAIGLSFTIALEGDPLPQEEALDFAFFATDGLPENLWPGCRVLFERMGLG